MTASYYTTTLTTETTLESATCAFLFFCEEVIRNGFGVTDAVDNYGVLLDVEDRLVNEIYKYLVFSYLYFQ